MRALYCVCDEHLQAENDAQLFKLAQEHVDREHPQLRFGGERLYEIVARVTYEER
jgi:hypothetical protein